MKAVPPVPASAASSSDCSAVLKFDSRANEVQAEPDPGCDCLREISRLASETKGFPLRVSATLPMKRGQVSQAVIELHMDWGHKKPRGEKIPVMIATYCPWCGQKYPVEEAPSDE